MDAKINTAFAFFISCCGYVLISYQALSSIEYYQTKIVELTEQIVMLEQRNQTYRVTATMYQPVQWQTDDTPNELADGTVIVDIYKAHEYRYLALSRDLLKRWGGPFDYGDYVIVEGAGEHSGIWQVRDTMNKKWTNRIDFLMSPGHKPFKYDEVVIRSQKH